MIVVVFSWVVLLSSVVSISELLNTLFLVSFGVDANTVEGDIVFEMFNVLDTFDSGTLALDDGDVTTAKLDLLVGLTVSGDSAIDADLLIGICCLKLLLDAEAASVTGVIATADLDLLGGLISVGDMSDILLVMDADRLMGLRRSSHRPGFGKVGD